MTKRKFYKTVVQITILSDEPYVLDHSENDQSDALLSGIATDICSGPCVGDVEIVSQNEEKNGKEIVELLSKAGSDCSFFGLTEDGDEDGSLYDEDDEDAGSDDGEEDEEE